MSHPYQSRPVAETHVWLTPPEIIRALGSFDLDPCANVDMPWSTARHMLTVADDGLAAPWHGRVWLNPPYGPHTKEWLRKMADHGNGIALVFARTDTAMFIESVWPKASGIKFIAKRPHFHHADGTKAKGNSGGPLVLVAYGSENAEALRNSSIDGQYLPILTTGARER